MSEAVLRSLAIFFFPVVVFVAGAGLMGVMAPGRKVAGQKPLNRRWGGYTKSEVDGFWRALGDQGRRAERRFLKLDLVFPAVYGAALCASLVATARMVGGRVLVWPIVLVAVSMAADWVENLVQIDQLRAYREHGEAGLSSSRIRIASAATVVKLVGVFASYLVLALLLVLALR